MTPTIEASLIIPAYNEEATIGQVVDAALKDPNLFKEVIVVDDGGSDNTAVIAQAAGATVIIHDHNMGKGAAVRTGLEHITSHVVCIIDADLLDLRATHLWELTHPVTSGQCQATMAIFSGGRWLTTLAQILIPAITGQRCLQRNLLKGYTKWNTRFGLEVSLNFHLRRKGIEQMQVKWDNVSHRMKEEKRGVIPGFWDRLNMYQQVIGTYCRELIGL